jgi:small multidrug resistance pump
LLVIRRPDGKQGAIDVMTWNYAYLLVAVAFEVAATMALKSTDGFTRLWPSLISIAGYALAFYFLSLPLRTLPVGIVYALWCGLGIFFLVGVAWIYYRQALDLPALFGLGLIVAGIAVINLFSKSIPH